MPGTLIDAFTAFDTGKVGRTFGETGLIHGQHRANLDTMPASAAPFLVDTDIETVYLIGE